MVKPSARSGPGAPVLGGPAARGIDRGAPGFAVEVDDSAAPLGCAGVDGFDEALAAARDAQAPMPARLVLVSPDAAMAAWLAGWSEDEARVRRTLSVSRLADRKRVTAVATLSSHGAGVATSLAVESITSRRRGSRLPLLRSGVHDKAAVDAALRLGPSARSRKRLADGTRDGIV